MQDVLNEALEDAGSVSKTKWHDCVLEEAEMRAECSLPLVSVADTDEVEGILQVNDREELAALNAVEEVVNERERVAVLLGDGIEATVVDAEPELASLLAYEQDGGASRRGGASNEPFAEVRLDVLEESLALVLREVVEWSEGRRLAFLDLDGSVEAGAVRRQLLDVNGQKYRRKCVVLLRDMREEVVGRWWLGWRIRRPVGCCRRVPERCGSDGVAWRAERMVLEDSGRIVASVLAKTS